jgi:hypothetical protein
MMDTHSVVAVSPATDVVEDNRENLVIELPRIVQCYAVLEDCKCAEKKKKKEVSSGENPTTRPYITSLFIGT